MTDSTPDEMSGQPPHHAHRWRRIRLPEIDFVTLMLAILAAIILLFLTAELWLPHVAS